MANFIKNLEKMKAKAQEEQAKKKAQMERTNSKKRIDPKLKKLTADIKRLVTDYKRLQKDFKSQVETRKNTKTNSKVPKPFNLNTGSAAGSKLRAERAKAANKKKAKNVTTKKNTIKMSKETFKKRLSAKAKAKRKVA